MPSQTSSKLLLATLFLLLVQSLAIADHPRILIDCGGNNGGTMTNTPSPASYSPYSNIYWNNFNSYSVGGTINSLITTNGVTTSIGLTNTVAWGGANGTGTGALFPPNGPSTALLGDFGVSNATMDFFYVNSAGAVPAFKVNGLTAGNAYRLSFFGSRISVTTESKFTTNTLTGGNGTFVTIQKTTGLGIGSNGTYNGNDSNIVSTAWITPDANNQISDAVTWSSAGYMNVMAITVNRPPVAGNDSTSRNVGDPITITTASLMANDSDPDGDTIAFGSFGALPAGATTNAISITLPGTNTTQSFSYNIGDGLGLSSTGTVIVNFGSAVITELPTTGAISYGQTLANSSLTGGTASVAGSFAYTTPSLAPSAGSTSVGVTFTPSDSNYGAATTNVIVVVSRTTPVVKVPTPSSILWGMNLSASVLRNGAATNSFNNAGVPGSFAFASSTQQAVVGVTNVNVIFTPVVAVNYLSVTSTVAVAVVNRSPNQDFLVDFGPDSGTYGSSTASPDWLGQYWNNLTNYYSGSVSNLVTTNNVSTVVSLYINSPFYYYSGNAGGGGLLNPNYAWLGNLAVTNATRDYFYGTATNSPTFTFYGLNAGSTYTLRFFASAAGGTTGSTTFSVHAANGTFSTNLVTGGTGVGQGGSYNGNDNTIVSVGGATPNTNYYNSIAVVMSVASGTYSGINCMELMETSGAFAPPTTNEITSITINSDGSRQVNFTGDNGFSYRVQAATNLAPAVWVDVATNAVGGYGVSWFTDTNTVAQPQMFYRTVSP